MLKKIVILISLATSPMALADFCYPSLYNMPIRYTELTPGKVNCAYSCNPDSKGHAFSEIAGHFRPTTGPWIKSGENYVCVQRYPIDDEHPWDQCHFEKIS